MSEVWHGRYARENPCFTTDSVRVQRGDKIETYHLGEGVVLRDHIAILQGLVPGEAVKCEFRLLLNKVQVASLLGESVGEVDNNVLWETDIRLWGSPEEIMRSVTITTNVRLLSVMLSSTKTKTNKNYVQQNTK